MLPYQIPIGVTMVHFSTYARPCLHKMTCATCRQTTATPRATLTLLSCSPNFPRASITRYTHAKHEPILKHSKGSNQPSAVMTNSTKRLGKKEQMVLGLSCQHTLKGPSLKALPLSTHSESITCIYGNICQETRPRNRYNFFKECKEEWP